MCLHANAKLLELYRKPQTTKKKLTLTGTELGTSSSSDSLPTAPVEIVRSSIWRTCYIFWCSQKDILNISKIKNCFQRGANLTCGKTLLRKGICVNVAITCGVCVRTRVWVYYMYLRAFVRKRVHVLYVYVRAHSKLVACVCERVHTCVNGTWTYTIILFA